jgi:hypothetical protein
MNALLIWRVASIPDSRIGAVFGHGIWYHEYCMAILRYVTSFSGFSTEHWNASPKLPVLPTNPACPLPSAEAAGTGVGG